MKLRFYARSGHLVPFPGSRREQGQLRRYIGREFDAEKRAYCTTKDGTEFNTDNLDPQQVTQLKLAVIRDGGLWCADADTAALIGVEFVSLKFNATDLKWDQVASVVSATKSGKTGGDS